MDSPEVKAELERKHNEELAEKKKQEELAKKEQELFKLQAKKSLVNAKQKIEQALNKSMHPKEHKTLSQRIEETVKEKPKVSSDVAAAAKAKMAAALSQPDPIPE